MFLCLDLMTTSHAVSVVIVYLLFSFVLQTLTNSKMIVVSYLVLLLGLIQATAATAKEAH